MMAINNNFPLNDHPAIKKMILNLSNLISANENNEFQHLIISLKLQLEEYFTYEEAKFLNVHNKLNNFHLKEHSDFINELSDLEREGHRSSKERMFTVSKIKFWLNNHVSNLDIFL
ncbi:MAG: hypothetical protein COA79_07695 [Planctomycetota bacterium]|nr:MAG: hypothetical protein COA79_07695 [Planctomycetota bacterium]